jgi:hypothetical protein
MPRDKEHWISQDEYSVMIKCGQRILSNIFRLEISEGAIDLGQDETDFSELSSAILIGKMKDYLATNPNEIGALIFLKLIAHYPIGMCSPHPTPILKQVIGFMYHYGQENEIEGSKSEQDKPDKISMDELAEWTGRSKASVKEYCDMVAEAWKAIKAQLEAERLHKKAHDQAFKELVEEEKKKILAEKTTEKTDVTEQTQISYGGGI